MKRAVKHREKIQLKKAAFWLVFSLKNKLMKSMQLKTLEERDQRRIKNSVVFKTQMRSNIIRKQAAKIVGDFI